MGDELEKKSAAAIQKAVGSVVTQVIADFARARGVDPIVVQMGTAVGPALFEFGVAAVTHSIAPRTELLGVGVTAAFDGDTGRAEEAVKDASPASTSLLYTSYRSMMDALDPTVIPCLGMLAGQYLREKKSPDSFYRGCGRLLVDLNAESLSELRRFLQYVIDCKTPVAAIHAPHPANPGEGFYLVANVALVDFKHLAQLTAALKTNWFIREPQTTSGAFMPAPLAMQMNKPRSDPFGFMAVEDALRLRAVIGIDAT